MAVRTAVDVLATVAADLLAAAPIGVAVLDPDLRYAYVNQALAEMNGLPVGEHLGRAVSELLPDLATDVVPMFEDVLRTGEGQMDVEIETGPVPRRPGRRCTWHVSYIPLRFGSPRVEGLAVLAQDVTELRENEALRNRQAARMERLAALASGVAAAASVDQVADVIGALAGNAIGASVTGVALPDGDVLRFVGAAARGGEGRWCPVRVADDQPLAAVARTGEPLFLPAAGAMLRPWPQLRPLQERYDEHAWAILPLLRPGQCWAYSRSPSTAPTRS